MAMKRFFLLLLLAAFVPALLWGAFEYGALFSDFLWLDNDHCLVKIYAWHEGIGIYYNTQTVLIDVRAPAVYPVNGAFVSATYTLTDDRVFLSTGHAVVRLDVRRPNGCALELIFTRPFDFYAGIEDVRWLYGDVLGISLFDINAATPRE